MAVSLLPLSNGRCSLEFASSDRPRVAEAIRDLYGPPDAQWHATFSEYRFGGCTFIFQDEWDEPCLISGSAEGDAVLRRLSDRLGPGQ